MNEVVSLRLGTPPSDAVHMLTDVHRAGHNVLTQRRPGVILFNEYLRWVADSARVLTSVVTDEALRRLLLTPTHWSLQGVDPSANVVLSEYVELELHAALGRLVEARSALLRDVDAWAVLPGPLICPDTNVYLHHQSTDLLAIDWTEMLRDSRKAAHPRGPVVIVIPMLVVDELDANKNSGTRLRARQALRLLFQLFSESDFADVGRTGHPQVRARLVPDEAVHARLPHPDSELIDRLHHVSTRAQRPVTLLTFDTGMALRARTAGLPVRLLPDDHRAETVSTGARARRRDRQGSSGVAGGEEP